MGNRMWTVFLVVLAGACMAFAGQQDSTATLTPKEAEQKIESDSAIFILDVRTPEEYLSESGHLRGAKLIPVQELEERADELAPYRNDTIITYCKVGVRSARAARILAQHGYHAYSISGGIDEWNAENLPVVKEGPK